MTNRPTTKAILIAGTIALVFGPLLAGAAAAQPAPPPPPPGYQGDVPPPGYNGEAPPAGYNGGPPPGYNGGPPPGDVPPPVGYDGTRMPPPPPGYQQGPDWRDQQAADQRYAWQAEQWAHEFCVKAHGNTAAGAVIGGVLGMIVGGGIAGPGSRGFGSFAGGALGAGAGAAIASNSNSDATSPGCPPGFVVRGGARWGYAPPGYYYAAPGWYRPWVFIDGNWIYRPYPYHSWYWHHYHDWDGRGYYGHDRGWHRRY
ncbi:MAG: hypothetical protein KGK11_05955 [Sphingomonadales bacterium]|nr:hypothetical protein [Sphingomonadales bacterium]